jgi:hypothetical protein
VFECINLLGRERFHIEKLGDASAEKNAPAVQYRNNINREAQRGHKEGRSPLLPIWSKGLLRFVIIYY